MSPIVFYFCGSLLPVFISKAKCKVIFNYRALLFNEALLMQASVSDIKDKETAHVAELKWDSLLHFLESIFMSPFTAVKLDM